MGTAATRTKPRTGLRAAEPRVMDRSGLAQNGPRCPLPVLSSPSQLCAGSISWLSRGWSVWPEMGMRSQPGNAPLCTAPQSPPRGQTTAGVAEGSACPCRRCSPQNTLWGRGQLGLARSCAGVPGSGLSPGSTAVDVAGLTHIPSPASHRCCARAFLCSGGFSLQGVLVASLGCALEHRDTPSHKGPRYPSVRDSPPSDTPRAASLLLRLL